MTKAWMLPIATIALVGFGVFMIAEAWDGYAFTPAPMAVGCAALMGALCVYRIWSRKA